MTDINTQKRFDKLAENGTWQSRYDQLNFINYNFLTRRKTVERILDGDFFPLVLDLGCGTGDYFEILSNISERYIGVDFSSSMIKQANHKYGNFPSKPLFIEGNAESLPFEENRFDLVCAIGFIEYFSDPNTPMREIIRILKPGGVLVIQSFQIDFYKNFSKIIGLDLAVQIGKYLYHTFWRSASSRFTTDKPYTKDELDRLMGNFGFIKNFYFYNNFNVFPKIIRRLFPKVYIFCSEKIANWNPNLFGIFAVNYIGRYILNKSKNGILV